MPEGWPLVGRAEELQVLDRLHRPGGPVGLVLAGAAGVGKTRLAREAVALAARRGLRTRWAAATASARALPLGAFGTAVGDAGSDPSQLLRRAGDTLLAGAGQGGVVVGVDDGHLLDNLSAALVHQLVLDRSAAVVLTVRSGEPSPDAVTALWKDGHLPRLELAPLSEGETGQLLEAVLGGAVESATARALWTVSRGNVLYLRQLVDGELAGGTLRRTAGVWRRTGEAALSPGLVELVQQRIGALSDAERDVVELLAFGEPLGVPLLHRLTDPAAVERAEARGLVEVSVDGRRTEARLAHPLYGEVQRARCGTLRARRLRGRILRALGETGARRAGDLARRALLAVDADGSPDPDLLADGAQRLLELCDCAQAERLARAALGAGAGFEARLTLGYALSWMGRGSESETELARLTECAETPEHQRVRSAVPRVGNLFWTLFRPADAEAVLAAALAAIPDGPDRLVLEAIGSAVDAYLGRTVRAAATAARVLADARCPPDALVLATWGLVTACGGLGRTRVLREHIRLNDEADASFHLGLIRFGAIGDMWLRALRLSGELEPAETIARGYGELAGPGGGPLRSMVTAALADVSRDSGLVRTALRRLREAASGPLSSGWLGRVELSIAVTLDMLGDGPAARRALASADAGWHPGFVFMEPDRHLARAWVAAAEGAVGEAVAAARRAAEVAASQAQPAVEVLALHTAVQFGDRTVAARLAELAGRVDGPRAPAAAAHAAALAADDGAALVAAADALERMGALLIAADALAQAAVAFGRSGRRGSASAAAARATRLAGICEGAATPALRAMTRPLPLTPREREIVTLAASGLSNRGIAERLVLSVRTVEGHLYRACAKLGVTDRSELAAIIGTGPPAG